MVSSTVSAAAFRRRLFIGAAVIVGLAALCSPGLVLADDTPDLNDDVHVPKSGTSATGPPSDFGGVIDFAQKAGQSAEQFEFQAEVSNLMGILVNSLYTEKEIFLRELVSNASDALDKIRFASLTDPSVLDSNPDMKIWISFDEETGTLHVTDTGVGMTRETLLNNLGTIAQSGTKDFVNQVTQGGDLNLIGQFGVGFYSVYLVAEEVVVTTKHNDDVQYIWHSTADSSFSLVEDPRGNTLGRGTTVSLKLMPGVQKEFLNQHRIGRIISRYSAYIDFPIFLRRIESVELDDYVDEELVEAEDLLRIEAHRAKGDEDEDDFDDDDDIFGDVDDVFIEDDDERMKKEVEDKAEAMEARYVEVWQWRQLNDVKPLWTRPTDDISEEEYKEFFYAFHKGRDVDPLETVHFSAEGDVGFKALVYVPESRSSHDPENGRIGGASKLKLYIRRVFITDELTELLPRYLEFVSGVIDSDDLPLNVARESLQENKVIRTIRRKIVRKVFKVIEGLLAEGGEKVDTFYEHFGVNLKLGVIEDMANQVRLSKMLRFRSSTGEMTTFDDYVERMKKGQKQIYYLGGADVETLERSPFVERLFNRGYEVLFMTDPIDEYVVRSLRDYDGFTIQDVSREGLKLGGDADKVDVESLSKESVSGLTKFLRRKLRDRVERVVVSKRLTSSPAALVTTEYGTNANMERIMRAQALPVASATDAKRVFEINPNHPIIVALADRVEIDVEDEVAHDLSELLYETSLLQSGFTSDDPSAYASRVYRFLKLRLDLDEDAEAEDVGETDLHLLDVEDGADVSEDDLDLELGLDRNMHSLKDEYETYTGDQDDDEPASENQAEVDEEQDDDEDEEDDDEGDYDDEDEDDDDDEPAHIENEDVFEL